MIDWFDETCGDLLGHLEAEGLSEDTLVVYLADNGWTQDPDGPGFIRSKRSPYDSGLRTPIMIRWPGQVTPGMSDELASSIDLAPTLLEAAGMARTPEMQGVNLLDRTAVAQRNSVFGACYEHTIIDLNRPAANLRERWVVEGDWKLIVPTNRSDLAHAELYNLDADPGELHDRAATEPDRVEELSKTLDAWWDPTP